DSGNGAMPYIDRSGLTPGTMVWIRFWEYGNDANGTFQICAYSPTPPGNDNPCGATDLTVGTTCSFANSTTIGASASTGIPAPGCASYNGGDVWFSAVVPASGRIIFDSNTGGLTDGGMALYTTAPNNCSGTFTLVECDDDDSGNGAMPYIDRSGLTPGTTVWIRFWEFGNDANGTFQICAYSPPPPANDNPCAATLLPVGSSCSFTTSTNAFATSTSGPPAPTCGSYAGADVWFRFVVPANGFVVLETAAGAITDGAMAVYSAATCAGPFTQLYCDDDNGPGAMPYLTMSGLSPGTTLWVRFWSFNNIGSGTFNICARTITGDCVYLLKLFDSFGDGWGSSNVGVRINGGTWTYYTVAGEINQVLFGLMIGDFIELSYNASGPDQDENSYLLGTPDGGVFFTTNVFPTAGPSFAQLVDCSSPPAGQQDCMGGSTICNAQAISNNSGNTGIFDDISAANRGCLLDDEQQGTWYYFSPSASGTIGFNITPTTGIPDYDFAIWGPLSAIACPPNSPPIRCSYALPPFGGPYDTGLATGNTDTSEGAGGNGFVAPLNVIAGQVYILYVDNFSTSGSAFNLTWQLSGGASLDCSILPVELVNLRAAQQGGDVALAWTTLSESGSDHFLVERSADGIHFSPLGLVEAAHSSTVPVEYRFDDEQPHPGINFYRVTLIDQDGTTLMSNVVSETFEPLHARVLVVPNPALDAIQVIMPAPEAAGTLALLDATGRLIREAFYTEGETSLQLTLPELDSGVYMVRLTDLNGRPSGTASFAKE
ncbi:MAG: T9SS type A sorting domain-containing protein, partial [Flavobacteriales bacterium]